MSTLLLLTSSHSGRSVPLNVLKNDIGQPVLNDNEQYIFVE